MLIYVVKLYTKEKDFSNYILFSILFNLEKLLQA